MRIQPAVPHFPSLSTLLRLCVLLACLLLAAGCSDDDPVSAAVDDGDSNPPRITGRVLSTPDQLVAGPGGGVFAAILRLLTGYVQAATPGLVPAPGIQVELLRVGGGSNASGTPVETVTTDADGGFVIDRVPSQGLLMLRANLRTEVLRGFVTGENAALTPASELAVRRVEESVREGDILSAYSRTDLAALSGYLEGLRVEAADSFNETIAQLDARAGRQFDGILDNLGGSDGFVIGEGNRGVVEFTTTLRDPLLADVEGFSRGVDVASGVGMLTLDAEARAEHAFVPRAVFVGDIVSGDSARAVSSTEDLIPGDDLRGLAYAAGRNGQVLLVDPARPQIAVVPGAITDGGAIMVNPLLIAVDGAEGLVAAGAGLQFATRWPAPVFAAETLTSLDPLGGEATLYHLVRMFHSYPLVPGMNVAIGAGSGTISFDSSPQSRAFIGDSGPDDYGGFQSSLGRGAMKFGPVAEDSSDSGFQTIIPSSGLFRVLAGTGMIELRANDDSGSRIGGGVMSADGQVAVMEMSASDENRLERALTIAIRHSGDVPPPVSGHYHLVGYANRVIEDSGDDSSAVAVAIRQGMLHLNAEDGLVDEADLLLRMFRLKAAATGSIGAGDMEETLVLPGSWTIDGSGAMRLELELEQADGSRERIEAVGAAAASGDFIALAVRGGTADGEGRGLLILVRQSGR